MAFTPHSTVYLLDTPLKNDYNNQFFFANRDKQYAYFNSRIRHTFNDITYQRKDNVIQVDKHIDELWDVNYCMYRNKNFSNKWFYAFITDMKYKSDSCTEVYIETDVYQTWLSEAKLQRSFVVREHVKDDTIGANLVDEGLEIGDYKMQNFTPTGKLGRTWFILAVSDLSIVDYEETIGNKYGNLFTGLAYIAYPPHEINLLKNAIENFTTAGKADAITMIFTVPEIALPNNNNTSFLIPNNYTMGVDTLKLSKSAMEIDSYMPKNNKLYVYPYRYFYVTNNQGGSAVYRYEDFPDNDMNFTLFSSVTPNPKVMMAPEGYKGANNIAYDYGLMLGEYPLCSWTSDVYNNWFAQNSGSLAIGLISSGASVLGGIATGSPLAIGGGALAVASQLAQVQKASMQPDQAKGNVNAGSLNIANESQDFFTSHMEIKHEYAKRIDDFFHMYGYKVNALKVPEYNTRKHWNYIQTIDVNIHGAIPQNDMNKLKKMYDDGVTLWHNPATYLNYWLDNEIIV